MIKDIVSSTVSDLGFELVKLDIKSVPRRSKYSAVEVMIDRYDNSPVTLKDCRNINRQIISALEIQNMTSEKYFVDVSSAGIERPLFSIEHYERFVGHHVKLSLKNPIKDKSKYIGEIYKVQNDVITLQNKEEAILIEFDNIQKARLFYTDVMFQKMLKNKKGK